jgi:PAS domain S-box-containing protein
MAPAEREQRLQFIGLTDSDAVLLQNLRPVFEKHRAHIVDAFYAHLLTVPELAQLLRDRTTVERLKRLQGDYLLRITEGKFDESYFADRLRIGQAHDRVGLSPHWYLLSYQHYLAIIAPLIQREFAPDATRASESITALQKAFMLDVSLAMDAYIASDRFRHAQQLESIVNDSADVIFMLDNDKRFRTWNRAAERIFGWKASEILGQHLKTIIPPEELKSGELARIDKALETHGSLHLVTMRLAKDGRRVPVELSLSLLRNPQGQVMGRSVIARDISERRRLEQANIQAERLATIGAMSAKLAHEIRNPLSSIVLNIELVRDEVEALTAHNPASGDESRALLKSIHSEVRRIQRVTEDYLQFARLPKLQRDRVHIHDILSQGLSFMESFFQHTGVSVHREFAEEVPLIFADESQLWQAVLNIIRNAIEAMPDGGSLHIRTHCERDAVVLRISDTGKGMTSAERAQLFKPFFSTKTGGTGLGLPLTQQIIAEHGGTIECESEPGKGACFIIRLPHHSEKQNGTTG